MGARKDISLHSALQRKKVRESEPRKNADHIIENNDPANPTPYEKEIVERKQMLTELSASFCPPLLRVPGVNNPGVGLARVKVWLLPREHIVAGLEV